MKSMKKTNNNKKAKNKKVKAKRYIPSHILCEIFCRVPYKSLRRLKPTCKQWCNLINDGKFFDEYRQRAANLNPQYFLVRGYPSANDGDLLLYSIGRDNYTHIKTMKLTKCYEIMLPSSSSMVCVHGVRNGKIALFNPMLPETTVIPQQDLPVPHHCRNSLGFGFDFQSRKYKIVQLAHDLTGDGGLIRCYVLAVGLESYWRVIDLKPLAVRSIGSAYCVGGVLHWEAWPLNFEGFVRILMFDLSCEKMDMISTPYKLQFDIKGRYHQFVELQGKICFVELAFSGGSLQMDISALKCSEWVSLYKLELGNYPASVGFSLLCIKHDKILLADQETLYSYDIKKKSLEVYEGNGDQKLSSLDRGIVYSEAIV